MEQETIRLRQVRTCAEDAGIESQEGETGMNKRKRQQFKAFFLRKNPNVMAIINEEGQKYSSVIFIDREKMHAYKERYGNRIEFIE